MSTIRDQLTAIDQRAAKHRDEASRGLASACQVHALLAIEAQLDRLAILLGSQRA